MMSALNCSCCCAAARCLLPSSISRCACWASADLCSASSSTCCLKPLHVTSHACYHLKEIFFGYQLFACGWHISISHSGVDQACAGLRMILVTVQPDFEQSVTWAKLSDLACQESSLVDHSFTGTQPNSATQHTRVMQATGQWMTHFKHQAPVLYLICPLR